MRLCALCGDVVFLIVGLRLAGKRELETGAHKQGFASLEDVERAVLALRLKS